MGVLVGVAVADREVHRLSPISEQRGSTVSRSLVHKYTPEALAVQLVSLASTVQSPGYVPNGAINSGVVTDSKPLYTTLAMQAWLLCRPFQRFLPTQMDTVRT